MDDLLYCDYAIDEYRCGESAIQWSKSLLCLPRSGPAPIVARCVHHLVRGHCTPRLSRSMTAFSDTAFYESAEAAIMSEVMEG